MCASPSSAATPARLQEGRPRPEEQAGGELKGFVLDLRNDPGGLLTAAVEVAGVFLDGGTVVSIRGRHRGDDQTYTAPANGDMLPNTPVVVLINGASASASEIVAGALQDRQRGKVLGTQSFGKGSVQTIIPLNGHGALRLTTALYYTPGGRSIQGEGIAPDVVVEAPKDQQVAGALMLRESALNGAFRNPGSLLGKPKQDENAKEGAPPRSRPTRRRSRPRSSARPKTRSSRRRSAISRKRRAARPDGADRARHRTVIPSSQCDIAVLPKIRPRPPWSNPRSRR